MKRLPVLYFLLWLHCGAIGPGASGLNCYAGTVNLCLSYSIPSWMVSRVAGRDLDLSNCNYLRPQVGDQLLLFVSHGGTYDYGKFEVVTVTRVTAPFRSSVCTVYLRSDINTVRSGNQKRCLIAQKLPHLGDVHLYNGCILTCNSQSGGLGGILAFRASNLNLEGNARIDMSGKGLRGGIGGYNAGAGGAGGETQYCPILSRGGGGLMCPSPCTAGKGGDAGMPGSAGGDQEAPQNEYFTRLLMGEGGGGGGGGDYRNNYMPGGRGGDGGGLVYLQVDQLTMSRDSTIVANGLSGSCYNGDYRSAAGGSGGGGSVIVWANRVKGYYPWDRISVSGASSVRCSSGAAGGGGGGNGQWAVTAGRVRRHS